MATPEVSAENQVRELVDELAALEAWNYHPEQLSAAEPAALTAMALLANDRRQAAEGALSWLASHQHPDGEVGIFADQGDPGWPTSLAAVAWQAFIRDQSNTAANVGSKDPQASRYIDAAARSVKWMLATHGVPVEQTEVMGHDTSLIGWSWCPGTHSWIEPTAMHVVALKKAGLGDHPRVREGVRLILDRMLAEGGCNYGNTYVLGQQLRPHIQPTGIALLALRNEDDPRGRARRSIEWLRSVLSEETSPRSLCYGLMGLAAHDRLPDDWQAWLQVALQRTRRRGATTHNLALIALATVGAKGPLITA